MHSGAANVLNMHPSQTANGPIGRAAIREAAAALCMAEAGTSSPARLISLLCDERLSAEELATKIEAHPVLSARVLQVANSPYYGQAKSVGTIKRALQLLGVNAIRGVAAAAFIDQVLPRRIATLPDTPSLLRHSLATAIVCEMLAAKVDPLLAPNAFIAGLIHNLGTVVQASLDPGGTAAVIAARRAEPCASIRTLEQQHCQLHHEACGAVLFDEWQLPDSLVNVAMHHHSPDDAPDSHRPLVGLVWVSANLALSCAHTFLLEPAIEALDYAKILALGLRKDQIDAVADKLPERMEVLSRALT
jgi:HD-like signal output (HDOD) protein